MSWTAVVLAGSRPGRDAFAEQYGSDLKALIPIAGEPMVRRPVRALLESESVGRVIVMAQDTARIADALPSDPRIFPRRSQGTIAETILELIGDASVQWPLLVTTADHALLDPSIVDEFCSASKAVDVAIGVVERANLMKRLPETKRTWLRFRGGAYTGANLFALRSREVAPAVELWRTVEQDRKKARRVMSIVGPLLLARVALRMISLDHVLGRIGAKLKLSVKAVRLGNPLAGVDVDKAADHALVEDIIAGRA